MAPYRIDCDICGRFRTGHYTRCSRCSLNICERCWCSQRRVGHEQAEHGNEIDHELGGDQDWDENNEGWY